MAGESERFNKLRKSDEIGVRAFSQLQKTLRPIFVRKNGFRPWVMGGQSGGDSESASDVDRFHVLCLVEVFRLFHTSSVTFPRDACLGQGESIRFLSVKRSFTPVIQQQADPLFGFPPFSGMGVHETEDLVVDVRRTDFYQG